MTVLWQKKRGCNCSNSPLYEPGVHLRFEIWTSTSFLVYIDNIYGLHLKEQIQIKINTVVLGYALVGSSSIYILGLSSWQMWNIKRLLPRHDALWYKTVWTKFQSFIFHNGQPSRGCDRKTFDQCSPAQPFSTHAKNMVRLSCPHEKEEMTRTTSRRDIF
jgi:hypothetical protein